MKVKMLYDQTIAYGPQRVFAGQILELPEAFAQGLIDNGEAESAEPKVVVKSSKKKKAEKPEEE